MGWSFFGRSGQSLRGKTQHPRRRKGQLCKGRRPLFEALEARNLLAVFSVSNLNDAAVAPAGSLRAALDQANATAGPDTIEFDAGLTGTLTIAVGAGDLDISDAVTINGPGAANITIDGTGAATRLFNITDEAGDVTIDGLTLANGAAGAGNDGGAVYSNSLGLVTISDSILTGNSAGDDGGAVYATNALTLNNVTIGGVGAGLPNTAVGDGGGVYAGGTLSVNNSTITGNTAGGDGGGIYAAGLVNLQNSTIGGAAVGAGNTATSSGGGVFALTLDATNSTISGNTATNFDGGGAYVKGNATLRNSTVSGNTAGDDGGGIYSLQSVNLTSSTIGGIAAGTGNTADDDGGGIYATNVTTQNSTIAGNTATDGTDGNGGGIFVTQTAMIKNSTIAENEAGGDGGGINGVNITLQNSTVANNEADFNNGGMGLGGGVFATNKFTMQNSIAAGNTDEGTNPDLDIPAGNNSKVKFSLIADNTGLPAGAQFTVTGPAGAPNAAGNIIGMPGGANAITLDNVFGTGGGVLDDNGGPTPTIALLTGAIAINRGKNNLAVASSFGDQRGLPFVRISGGTVDMGAYEFQPAVPGNIAPIVANPIADQSAVVDTPYVLTFPANTFTDADGDPLSFTATLDNGGALPAWLTFNAAARTFIGVPTAADLGAFTVRVTASDGKGGTVFDDFLLTVGNNPPPTVVNPIPDRNATVAVPFNFTFAANTFADPSGETLTYSAALAGGGALPAWLTFNPATRTFSGTPGAGDIGVVAVRVTATDPHGNSVFDDFNINVTNSELPFQEDFEGATPDPRIVVQTPAFNTTSTAINGTASYQATRNNVGDRPVSTVNFANAATAGNIMNVQANVSPGGGNGSSLWSNAVIVFDYVDANNYKYAGVFEIIDQLVIGQIVNGVRQPLKRQACPTAANDVVPLNLTINRASGAVTLTTGTKSVSHTFASIGTGTVGVGTINANARFDSLQVS